MSQKNVEVVAGYFEAVHLAASIDALAEDVAFVFHGETRHLAGAETISGKRAAVAWLADWFSRFGPDYRFEIEESFDWDDRVLVVTTNRGTGRASGVPVVASARSGVATFVEHGTDGLLGDDDLSLIHI